MASAYRRIQCVKRSDIARGLTPPKDENLVATNNILIFIFNPQPQELPGGANAVKCARARNYW